MTDRLLEPLLGGVYAGHARELSFQAVAPELYWRYWKGGSLLQHAAALAQPDDARPVFAGLAGGVSTVVDLLVADLTRSRRGPGARGPPSDRSRGTTTGSG